MTVADFEKAKKLVETIKQYDTIIKRLRNNTVSYLLAPCGIIEQTIHDSIKEDKFVIEQELVDKMIAYYSDKRDVCIKQLDEM